MPTTWMSKQKAVALYWLFFIEILVNLICALPSLPQSRNVESNLIVVNEDLGDAHVLQVKEFIDELSGSIRVDVKDEIGDMLNSTANSQNKFTSYYRLLEHGPGQQVANVLMFNEITSSKVVAYYPDSNRCKAETTSTWKLKSYSQILDDLFAVDEDILKTKQVRMNGASIGPDALLRIANDNANRLTLDSEAFDDLRLSESYYFSYKFKLDQERDAKIVAAISLEHIDDQANNLANSEKLIEMGVTKLADLRLFSHVNSVALIYAIRNDSFPYLDERSIHLLDLSTSLARQVLLITFTLIQERSLSKHIGVAEVNQIALPRGVGCGLVSEHRPLRVLARQFSGQFEAFDHSNEYFVAFDEESKHFRYDSIGEHKMIYSLGERLAIFITAPNGKKMPTLKSGKHDTSLQGSADLTKNEGGTSGKDNFNRAIDSNSMHESGMHCAEARLEEEPRLQSQMTGDHLISDILGLGAKVDLLYLGYDFAANCHLFEREISHLQVPLLVNLHIRLRVRQRADKLTLVFCLVNELDALTKHNLFYGEQFHAYESMWLKEIELLSTNNIQKYTNLNARLSFSKSSWTLATISEEPRNRRARLLHPARMFDTLECWPSHLQIHIDFLLKRLDNSIDEVAATNYERYLFKLRKFQLETLEETVISFLAHQINFPRAGIGNFQLVPAESDDNGEGDEESATSEVPSNMLISAELVRPFDYVYSRLLVGYVKSIEAILHARHAKLLKRRYWMTGFECSLQIATSDEIFVNDYKRLEQFRNRFYMLYCPFVGCGYLTVDKLNEVDYLDINSKISDGEKKQETIMLASYPDMCEIFQVTRQLAAENLILGQFKPEVLKSRLERTKMLFESYKFDKPSGSFKTYEHVYQVDKVSVINGMDLMDHEDDYNRLLPGTCYAINLSLELEVDGYKRQKLDAKVVQLNLDQHQSRMHCHKACLLYELCQTYSYSHRSRRCHLTDVTRSQLHDPKITLKNLPPISVDCSIYAINKINLYKRKPIAIYDSPSRLLMPERKKKLIVGSLNDCANVCNLNEIVGEDGSANQLICNNACEASQTTATANQPTGCLEFIYVRQRGLCFIDSKDLVRELPRELAGAQVDNSDNLNEKLNLNGWNANEIAPNEFYIRDYLQYYATQKGFGLYLEQPDEGQVPPASGSASALSLLHGLTLTECSRECTVLDGACVMFDHCSTNIKGTYTQLCFLYSIRSPLTLPALFEAEAHTTHNNSSLRPAAEEAKFSEINHKLKVSSLLEAQLTGLEAQFYIAGKSAGRFAFLKPKENCRHFYLEGDNLFLKRMLNVAARNAFASKTDQAIKMEFNKSIRDKASNLKNQDFEEELMESSRESGVPNSIGSWRSFASLTLRLLTGGAIGFLLFAAQPNLIRNAQSASSSPPDSGSSSTFGSNLFGSFERSVHGCQRMLTSTLHRVVAYLPTKASRERSMSQVEITEMIEIEEGETTRHLQDIEGSAREELNESPNSS